ncbi:uncharacterized protein G2W53_037095 [Senna tora]|uniref:Uncharacterized protein n=1 Tax=Senna tora TaxID=362788 RepID=A0A834W5S1_9FABA|nr:uncharacterized protein G2W53_037095 [Senna tora]
MENRGYDEGFEEVDEDEPSDSDHTSPPPTTTINKRRLLDAGAVGVPDTGEVGAAAAAEEEEEAVFDGKEKRGTQERVFPAT